MTRKVRLSKPQNLTKVEESILILTKTFVCIRCFFKAPFNTINVLVSPSTTLIRPVTPHIKYTCIYFHSDSICDLYLETGICWRQTCQARQPKVCRYSDKCYRGNKCRFLHFKPPCERCQVLLLL